MSDDPVYRDMSGLDPALAELIMRDPQAAEVLSRRAGILAQSDTRAGSEGASEPYVRFRLGPDEHYGIPYAYTEEILYADGIARVPCVPAHFSGVINRRGDMLAVIDLKQFFRVSELQEPGDERRIIVVSANDLVVGILADEVIGNEEYEPGSMAPALPSASVTSLEYISGIHDSCVTMLDVEALLADPAFLSGTGTA